MTLKNLGITDIVFNVDVKIIITDSTILNTTTGNQSLVLLHPEKSLLIHHETLHYPLRKTEIAVR